MQILIYGLNFQPELTGIGKYTGEMAKWLTDHGHEVRVITAPPYYPAWKISAGYSTCKYTKETLNKIRVFRCPLWVPNQPKTITRLIHLLSFSLSSTPVLLKQIIFWRPNVVICIAPSFFCAPQTVLFSKLAGLKSWLHFQDFEICAMFGSGMLNSSRWLNSFAHWIQTRITRRFDVVSTISNSMCDRANMNQVGKKKVLLFPNWVDPGFITPDADGNFIRQQLNIPIDAKVILYSGNIGKKQGLEIIIEAAKDLQNQENILFVIVGEGAHKTTLLKIVAKAKLQNINFFPLQPYELLPNLLRMADIHLVIQKKGAADAVLPSKLTSILSAGGHAIITAEEDTELGKLTVDHPGIATLIPPEDKDSLVAAISQLCKNGLTLKNTFNTVARDYAVQHLGKETVLSRFTEQLQSLLSQ